MSEPFVKFQSMTGFEAATRRPNTDVACMACHVATYSTLKLLLLSAPRVAELLDLLAQVGTRVAST